jgi:class 3 adenylate cyclase
MDILANAIYANNGEIDKFLGDGILGFFQMPHDAVQAAMDIQNQVRVFNKLRVNGLNIPLNTRIGLATGKILLARVGSQLRKEYTLIGDRVNVAARIQSIAPAGGLSMDETTYQTLGNIPGLIPDFISLKGKQKRELIYSVQPESIPKLAEFTQTPTQI